MPFEAHYLFPLHGAIAQSVDDTLKAGDPPSSIPSPKSAESTPPTIPPTLTSVSQRLHVSSHRSFRESIPQCDATAAYHIYSGMDRNCFLQFCEGDKWPSGPVTAFFAGASVIKKRLLPT